MNYAVAEHRLPGSSEHAVNLTRNVIELAGVKLAACPNSLVSLLERSIQIHDNIREHDHWNRNTRISTMEPEATEVLENYQKKSWVSIIFVSKRVYDVIRELRGRSMKFGTAFDKVVCEEYKDDAGNFI